MMYIRMIGSMMRWGDWVMQSEHAARYAAPLTPYRVLFILVMLMACALPFPTHAFDLPALACSDQMGRNSAVIGKSGERIYLHPSYPPECNLSNSKECDAKSYVVPNDVVSVHTVCGEWTYVTYINKELRSFSGWISSGNVPLSRYVSLAELTKQPKSATSSNSDKDICKTVADFATRGVLERFSVPEESILSEEDAMRLFGKDAASMHQNWQYWHIDLDDDGIKEKLIMGSQGTAHIGGGIVRSDGVDSKNQSLPDDASDISLIKIGGKYFFTTSERDELKHLFRFGKDGEFHSVCTFKRRAEPLARLILGKRNLVCNAVTSGKVRLIEFPLRDPDERKMPESFRADYALPLLANATKRLDIGNTGSLKNVTILSFASPVGRGCEWTQLVTIDDSGNSIPNNDLNRVLLGFHEENGFCGSNANAFVHAGMTYIDEQIGDGDRSIFQLRGNEMTTVCKFARYPITDVVDESEEAK